MLNITRDTKKLYINISLFKKRLKSAFITILKASIFLLAFSGIIWIFGAVGSSDLNIITIHEADNQILKGFFMCITAYILDFIKKFI